MALADDLARAAEAAAAFAAPDERVEAVLAAEPSEGRRLYLCAFVGASRTWLVLDESAAAVHDRGLVREVVSLAALCEVAGEAADDAPPRLASPAYLDAVATADVLAGAFAAVESLTEEVETSYKGDLR